MNETTIVADSGPLIAFARIGQLALLPKLSSKILVPPAVWEEVVVNNCNAPGAKEISQTKWIEIQVPDPLAVAPLSILLDRGEAAAIALAQGLPGSLLLVDDARARRIAERLHIRKIGTVGLLRRAKQRGFIELLRPHLDALQANRIYVCQELIEAVLKDVGEG